VHRVTQRLNRAVKLDVVASMQTAQHFLIFQ
jgi:hypothetical protein